MTENDHWAHIARREIPDDEIDVLRAADDALGPDWNSPLTTVEYFLAALHDTVENRIALEYFVLAQSLQTWGDFTDIAQRVSAIDNLGIGTTPNPAIGRPDVVYVKILSGVTQQFQALEAEPIFAAGMFTLVFSEQRGMWLIFAFGDPVHPGAIPAVA